jgi:hypothetical protein
LISLCHPYSYHLGSSACIRFLILYYRRQSAYRLSLPLPSNIRKRRILTHFPCPSPLLLRTADDRDCNFTPHPRNTETRPCVQAIHHKRRNHYTSDFGLDPGWRGNRSLRPSHSGRFSSTIQMSSREEKKSGITKSFRQKNAQINFRHRFGHDWFHGRLLTLRLSWSHRRWILLASAVLCGHLPDLLASAVPGC